jgi:Holliday junction resolvase RusA-like endonuclease
VTHQEPRVFVLPVPPSGNRYWRIWRGRAVRTKEAEGFKMHVWATLRCQGVKPQPGPVAVTVRWFRARKLGDLDNRLKVLLDAMQNTFYSSDAQIVELHAYRHEDPKNPRVEVTVERAA